jgi:hypothetical protein
MGWHGAGFLFGSHLSLTFLSSNASSSSDLGCGALELFHPMGGLVYRTLKTEIFRGVVEGRAGVANLLRLMRASFVAAHLVCPRLTCLGWLTPFIVKSFLMLNNTNLLSCSLTLLL